MRLGPLEIVLIVAIILLVFGPGPFRALRNAVAKSVKALQQSASGDTKD
jgi:TatA/E family protein of Tat protein translocase